MNERRSPVMVRVKLVNLDHSGGTSSAQSTRVSSAQISTLISALSETSLAGEASSNLPPVGIESDNSMVQTGDEICLTNGRAVPHADFEDHIEKCDVCSNRVELQLDFIETLEVAMYQRQKSREPGKVRGALLVSAPKMNFAICGEIYI